MQQRQFKPFESVSALTLGGGGLGQVWGETTREEAVATVNLAIEKGITHLDVAPMYGKGEAERVVGEVFKGKDLGDVSLVQGDTQIATIEHLMSAFAGLGIDNVIVEVDDMEVPIMDGSASPFVFLIQSAGIKQQTKPKKFIKIKEEIKVETPDGAYAKLAPYNGFKVTYALVYDDEKQKKYNSTSTVDFNSTTFLKEISRARTFGFMSDIDYMKKNKLALGGSEKNAVVIGEDEILNEDGLRSSQELVKHKILDVIGDLYLLQYNIVAEFEGYKSGHSLNNLLLNRLLELPDAWEVISSDGDAPEIRYIEPIIDPSSG